MLILDLRMASSDSNRIATSQCRRGCPPAAERQTGAVKTRKENRRSRERPTSHARAIGGIVRQGKQRLKLVRRWYMLVGNGPGDANQRGGIARYRLAVWCIRLR
jgi:hypothetical protein